jgi:hypothetical protein
MPFSIPRHQILRLKAAANIQPLFNTNLIKCYLFFWADFQNKFSELTTTTLIVLGVQTYKTSIYLQQLFSDFLFLFSENIQPTYIMCFGMTNIEHLSFSQQAFRPFFKINFSL